MRVALTGTGSFLGAGLLARLVEARGGDDVVAIDLAPAPGALDVRTRELDLTEPASDQRLRDLLRKEQVDTVVHLAFFTNPRRDAAQAHELESIGTLNLLAAAAAAGVRQVVLRSFTAVYGAQGQNPNLLAEDSPLRPRPGLRWVRDKLEAEQHAAAFARRYPEVTVTVLRFAPLLGPRVRTFYTRVLERRVVPVLMGYDPLLQLLHPEDALAALDAALARPRPGAFNIVPRRPIPLLSALHLAGKVPLPVPHPFAYAAAELLWAGGRGPGPAGFLDYVRFPFVADGARARRELGFEAVHSSREALVAYRDERRPAGALRPAEAEA
jgi:UDP-glucose 4-epimerase